MMDRVNVLVLIFVREPFKLLILKRIVNPVGVFQPVSGGMEYGEEYLESLNKQVTQ